jgi:hypothetical protein
MRSLFASLSLSLHRYRMIALDQRQTVALDKPRSAYFLDDFNNPRNHPHGHSLDSLTAKRLSTNLDFDAKETNYQVLRSLRSFYRFATKSLVYLVFHPDP